MKKRMMVLLLAAAMGMAMAGCQYGGDADAKSEQEETKKEGTKRSEEKSGLSGTVTLAAAASLEYAFEEELIPAFEELYPKVTIEGVYDSSGKLQQQIESGLAADLFFSAAPTQMSTLDEEGMIDSDSIVSLLENKIVLIIPTSSDASFASFEDIADSLKSPVLYPVAMTKEAPNQEATEAFYEFILSDDAMTIFESYGFTDYRSAE